MAWTHINMHGKYDLKNDVDTVPFDLNRTKLLNIKQIKFQHLKTHN